MTVMEALAGLPRSGEWTVDDLELLPDDGLQYELLDGLLLVSPAPLTLHQQALGGLHYRMRRAMPEGFQVLFAPVDFQPTRRRSFQPDLLVIRRGDAGERNLQVAPRLAVEVLSPSTRTKDLLLKRAVYAESGIPSYWIVDPTVPSLTVLELQDESYVELATVTGDQPYDASHPYPVTVTPSLLVH